MIDSMIDEVTQWAARARKAEAELEDKSGEQVKLLLSLSVVNRAIFLASAKHAGQKHSFGGDYIRHPLRIMEALAESDADEEEQAAGVLHDVVEDTDVTLYVIEFLFGKRIRDIVDAVTRREDESYEEMILRIPKNPSAIKVKLADLDDNLRLGELHPLPEPKQSRLRERYGRAKLLLLKSSFNSPK